jgi:hypothetical protein
LSCSTVALSACQGHAQPTTGPPSTGKWNDSDKKGQHDKKENKKTNATVLSLIHEQKRVNESQ